MQYIGYHQLQRCAMADTLSEIKDDEDAGEGMKRGAKKTGHRMEEGAEEAKDKVD